MKKEIKVKTKNKNYSVIIEENSIQKFLKSKCKLKENIFIIIDIKIINILDKQRLPKNISIIKINGSEKIKSIDHYNKIINKLLKLNIDRSSTIIAIGGGTVGDLTGFIASTILRGVNFILIPTTLLSQVDSSIGGKNGINSQYGKNLIGTFLHPDLVIIDPKILDTLSKKELRSGYAEILKHSLIFNKNFYIWLKKNYTKVLNLEKKYIQKAILNSIKIKLKYVTGDENEKLTNSYSRAILNFGHTFGHALETMSNYNKKLTHGEAISVGMSFALKISYKMKNISKIDYEDVLNHLKKIKLPINDQRIKNNKIYELIKKDKKNSNNKINLILLKKIGKAYYERNIEIKKIKEILNN